MKMRSPLQPQRRWWAKSRWMILALASFLLIYGLAAFSGPSFQPTVAGKDAGAIAPPFPWATSPAVAQTPMVNVADTARVLYERLPFMPLENHYVNQNGDPASESSLITRMLLYHTGVQQRQPLFRLDWKLTLADYLDANETIVIDTYPNASILEENPLEGDQAAIRQLTRDQRNLFVDTVVILLNPLAAREAAQPAESTTPVNPDPVSPPPSVRPGTGSTVPLPQEPQPGDAQLLLP